MADTKHLHLIANNFINGNIKARERKPVRAYLRQVPAARDEGMSSRIRRFCKSLARRGGPPPDYLSEYSRRCKRDRRLPLLSSERASGMEHALDAVDDFVMVEQFAAPRGPAALFHGFDEARVVFQHAVDGF